MGLFICPWASGANRFEAFLFCKPLKHSNLTLKHHFSLHAALGLLLGLFAKLLHQGLQNLELNTAPVSESTLGWLVC